ncbi:arylesterase [Phenylobacterium sp.]|uniref:arylesterase n=1 Tax=Phenylobacterium sp. TaxID=1871053 RepID=UPI0037C5E184
MPLFVAAWPALAAKPAVITLLGDSITAGYGLPGRAALPNQLQAALTRMGVANVVRAAGVSGDTTAGGLGRVDFSVQKDTSLAIVALGGNDLLQGLDPKRTRANLDGIIRKLKARKIPVLLVGITAPAEVGGGYARDFNAVFSSLAKTHGVPLYPNLIDGVARRRDLNQPDGIHPNAQGVQVITAKLAPVVAKALKR